MEAAAGFEPAHNGFAVRSLNHLGTPPYRGRTHTYTTAFAVAGFVAAPCVDFGHAEPLEDGRRAAQVVRSQVRVDLRRADRGVPEDRLQLHQRAAAHDVVTRD